MRAYKNAIIILARNRLMTTINNYTDFHNAEKYAHDYDAIISLGHCMPESFREGKKFLFLDFEDLDSEFCPQERHIRQLISFINELLPSDKLLIHCFAGYSRSPAAVLIAKCERDGKTFQEAKEELDNARIPDKLTPKPNEIMLRLYSTIK